MVAPANPIRIRLSPSGPEIGDPPAQIGGGVGAGVSGRVWRYQGTGTAKSVPGTAAQDIDGLSSVAVNLLPGYNYDVEFDGFTTGTGGNYKAIILGSNDGGLTFPVPINVAPIATNSGVYRERQTKVVVAAATVIDHLKVQWERQVSAGADLDYNPATCALVVTEWSTT